MVSCQKGPTCHTYAWQIGPFWQDTFDMRLFAQLSPVQCLTTILTITGLLWIWALVNKCQWNLNRNSTVNNQGNEVENVICKMAPNMSRCLSVLNWISNICSTKLRVTYRPCLFPHITKIQMEHVWKTRGLFNIAIPSNLFDISSIITQKTSHYSDVIMSAMSSQITSLPVAQRWRGRCFHLMTEDVSI